jgi:hypothetical protein
MNGVDLVAAALRDPVQGRPTAPQDWSRLIGQARSAGLLARVGWRLAQADLGANDAWAVAPEELAAAGRWPRAVGAHVESAWRLAQAQRAEVQREIRHLSDALAPIGAPLVLLKGAAYVAGGLPAALGRVFSDVDVLVPRVRLADVEAALHIHGWVDDEPSHYNQRYYREWMHELPPLRHEVRQTTLDVHHALLPITSRIRTPSQPLFDGLVPADEAPGVHVLSPPDMVLHGLTHLFASEEASHSLRDLSDADLLVRQFALESPAFWARLVDRGLALGLDRPLAWGLHEMARVLATPVPAEVLGELRASLPGQPWRSAMRLLWRNTLRSPHPSCRTSGHSVAMAVLYARGHWLRMPLPTLLRHLSIKALGLHHNPAPDEAPARGG